MAGAFAASVLILLSVCELDLSMRVCRHIGLSSCNLLKT